MLKKITLLITLILSISEIFAIGALELTIKGGVTIPNDELGNVYNADNRSINDEIVKFSDVESATGYTIGVKAGIPLADFFHGYAHVGVHQTGEEEFRLYQGAAGNEEFGSITASQFIIPIGVGGEIRFLELTVADLYASAQFNFNYMTSDVQIIAAQLDDNISETTNDIRMGYGFGVGSDFDLKFIKLNTELMYQALNPVLSEDEEDLKTLVSLTVGIVF